MFSKSSKQVALRDERFLVAKCFSPDGELIDASIDLNTCLGNLDGEFKVGDRDFILSARDIRLDGKNLTAALRRENGSYVHDSVNLDAFITNDCGKLDL
jgi:hypothetical protein